MDNSLHTEDIDDIISCPSCQHNLHSDDLLQLRIEFVKNQILQKLRLKERPNVSRSSLPMPIIEGIIINKDQLEDSENSLNRKHRDDYYGKTTQKIIFLDEDSYCC
uniref:Uncharacterized protein n=1 Tax=Phlebotomus papatasi TaxID=29031 RepID=A0A1B0EZJ7_PHLPP